jgi:hypothetical protein
MTMPIMLIILIPLVILAAVVLGYDLKRRRRPARRCRRGRMMLTGAQR